MSAINGGISFWYATDGLPTPREPLSGDAGADVVIVGGGYTGLWTAYYLKKAAPFLDIAVLESRFCGYGASGPQRRLALQRHRGPRPVRRSCTARRARCASRRR